MFTRELETLIKLANPWLEKKEKINQLVSDKYIDRLQTPQLLQQNWDHYITILVGPRQAGKTTLGRYLCQQLIQQGRYPTLLYLNCDESLLRQWFIGSHVIRDMQLLVGTEPFILFIDEVQRLENPGLLLKSIHDLQLPIKIIATSSSQLEIKSKVQEHLTGRHLESVILPLSYLELLDRWNLNENAIYGCYPQIVMNTDKSLLLSSLYNNYINKDIIEILKIANADTIRQLLILIAHGSGQLVNYQQLAADCRVSSHTIQHYLSLLENTYVIAAVKPFVGNKRTEITSNPIYYFLDNGFRNQALNNFLGLEQRTDLGLLVQSMVFQEIYKYKAQNYLNFSIHYWRTKSGAEVDFVLYRNQEIFLPVEVKYRNLLTPSISRGFRSFLQAYQPRLAIVLTKNLYAEWAQENCKILFMPVTDLTAFFKALTPIVKNF